jgi:hypothetical protein
MSPKILPQSGRLLTQKTAAGVWPAIEAELGAIRMEEIVAQCLSFHYRVIPAVEVALGVPCYFTIGHVELAGGRYFEKSEEELRQLLSHGMSGTSVGLHAWLTLPTMEILDFVFPSSYAVYNNIAQGRGQVIAEHGDSLPPSISFHPMLVGPEFLFRIGAVRVAI